MIRHIVSWKLSATDADQKRADAETMARLFLELSPLIPSIHHLQVGIDLGETANNWDFALLIDFDDTAGLDAYQQHPEHQRVAAFVREHASARSAVDFEF